MERRIAGMIGVATLAAVGAAPVAAAPDPQRILQAESFSELLQPIPNASELLAAVDAPDSRGSAPAEGLQLAQYHHHHHHHHHGYHHHYRMIPPWRHHRHHHHHHHYDY